MSELPARRLLYSVFIYTCESKGGIKRKRLYDVIERSVDGDLHSSLYDYFMLCCIIPMISSIFGIAIIALPAGIITARYMSEVENMRVKTSRGEEQEKEFDTF